MEEQDTGSLVAEVFNIMEAADSIEELEFHRVIDTLRQKGISLAAEMEKNMPSHDTYPKLDFEFTDDDIKSLIEKVRKDPRNREKISISQEELTPLEKFLFSIVWKNGDLHKIHHIYEGLVNAEVEDKSRKKGLVFYHFGQYLANRNKPIIDKHVLRAFAAFKAKGRGSNDFSEACKRGDITGTAKDLTLIAQYKTWFSNQGQNGLRDNPEFLYRIDQLLFALGKTIKEMG